MYNDCIGKGRMSCNTVITIDRWSTRNEIIASVPETSIRRSLATELFSASTQYFRATTKASNDFPSSSFERDA